MTTSTSTPERRGSDDRRRPGRRRAARGTRARRPGARGRRVLLVVAFWLLVWQVAAVVVGNDLLLASPTDVLVRLSELVVTAGFWQTVAHSVARIATGFTLGVVVGTATAAAAARWSVVDDLLTPLATAIRSTPVVSFIILVLIWADSGRLAVVVSLLMVAPLVHVHVLEGARSRDRALLEMADVFEVPVRRRVVAVDLPAVLPHLLAACQVGVGLAWKSGIAAEVIGLPQGSIGERLYSAKLFLSTADLLAWTLVIVLVALVSERLVRAGLRRAGTRLGAVAP